VWKNELVEKNSQKIAQEYKMSNRKLMEQYLLVDKNP
jgi:hypothetical protein